MKNEDPSPSASAIAPTYAGGEYFADTQRHSEDAKFKADNFLKLFLRFATQMKPVVQSFVDVGCGSGDIVKRISDSLRSNGYNATDFKAYDVSPHVQHIRHDGIKFILGDFCATQECVDVVTLFDVFEHVPGPVQFIQSVAQRCRIIGFHIPLDNSFNVAARNMFRAKLHDPGHLVFLDTASALNLLAMAGLQVVDYEYTFAFKAPSGHRTVTSKLLYPLRSLVAGISPWMLSKTLGGASLMVIALTPLGLEEQQPSRAL